MTLTLAALVGAGCGGDSGGSCNPAQPCGGDIVGTWDSVNSCVDGNALKQAIADPSLTAFCPSASVGAVSYKASGWFTFNADQSYSSQGTVMVDYTLNVPASCIQGLSCAALGDGIRANLAQDPAGSDGLTFDGCTGSNVCGCRFQGVSGGPESGTYATAGSTLTTTPTGSGGDQLSYCVQKDTLHVLAMSTTMNMGSMGSMTITSDITLKRR